LRVHQCTARHIYEYNLAIGDALEIPHHCAIGRGLDSLADARDDTRTGIYCATSPTGSLCEVCIDKDYYFNKIHAECVKCPVFFLQVTGILISIIFGVSYVIALGVLLVKRYIPPLIEIGPRAKLEIFITFYQIIASFIDAYGVTLSSRL
jgi:hypothetical protein